jgi:hypothetical protein
MSITRLYHHNKIMLVTQVYQGDRVSRFLNLYSKDVRVPFETPNPDQLGIEQTRWLGIRNFYNQSPIHTQIRWTSPDPSPKITSTEERLKHYLLLIIHRPGNPTTRKIYKTGRRRCLFKIAQLRMRLCPPPIILMFAHFHLEKMRAYYEDDLDKSLRSMLKYNYPIARLTKHPAVPLIYNTRGEEFITLYVSKYTYMFNLQRLFVTAKVLGLHTPQTLTCYRHLIKHVLVMRGPNHEDFLWRHVHGFLNFLYDYIMAKPQHEHKSKFYINNLLDILEFIEMPTEQEDGDLIIIYKYLDLYRSVWRETFHQMSRVFSILDLRSKQIILKLAVHLSAQYLLVYPDRRQELATILRDSHLPKQVADDKTMLSIAIKSKTCSYDDEAVYYSEDLIDLLRPLTWGPDLLRPGYNVRCMQLRKPAIRKTFEQHIIPYIKTMMHLPAPQPMTEYQYAGEE